MKFTTKTLLIATCAASINAYITVTGVSKQCEAACRKI